jgi:hypothetical protein
MMGLEPDGGPGTGAGLAIQHGQEPGLSGAEAWHTAPFWLVAGAFFLVSVSFHAFFIHLAPLLTDRGVSPQSAALAMSVSAIGGLVGRLGCGYLLDVFSQFIGKTADQ